MKKIYTHNFSDDATFIVASQYGEYGITGQNFLSEWDDNSSGYGGTSIYNKIIKDTDGDYHVVRANNSSRCSDHDFKTKFIGKTLGKINRNNSESVGQAQLGGSVAPHNFSYFEEVGYVTPENNYRVAKYTYIMDADIKTITPTSFSTALKGITVDVFEVTYEEFTERHGLGKSYNGWYNKSKLFRGLPFKIDYRGLVNFSRMRYQFRVGKQFKYELVENGESTITPIKPYAFPSNCGNLLRHYTDMFQVVSEDGEELHVMNIDGETYMGTLYSYETIRKSQTDKLQTLYRMVGGEDNVHPTHLADLDKPTVDVISADGTSIRMVYLWPNVSQWPAEFNNRKWIFVLSTDSQSPFARLKVKFRNSTFEVGLRDMVKKLARFHNLLSDTSNVKLKKDEDAEIDNYKKILQDSSNTSHAVTLLNTQKLLNDNTFELNKITQNDDDSHQFKLDLTFGNIHLQEWQYKQMDDEHLTELLARIAMPHTFKTITWVHGGHSDKLTKKLETLLKEGRYNLNGIEKIQIIHKTDLFIPEGYKQANVVYENQQK